LPKCRGKLLAIRTLRALYFIQDYQCNERSASENVARTAGIDEPRHSAVVAFVAEALAPVIMQT
jgi:hypothetical protein